MDTLTHALAGALLGEVNARPASPGSKEGLPASTRRGLYLSLAIVGSNLPDMDFLYSLITRSKIDYLLHHRGHTHTIIGVLLGAVLMYAVCAAWIRWRRLQATREEWYRIAGLALLTPLLHVAMDSTNTYGVHPFWPFNNQWLYGDSVFIVEPLFWAAATPLLFTLQTRIARGVAMLLMLLASLWIFSTGLIPLVSGMFLGGVALAMLAVGYRASTRVALITGICAWAGATLIFILAHGVAKPRVQSFLTERFPQARLLDQALSPMPVNPLCWEVIVVQMEYGHYTTRRAMLSLLPSWVSGASCPQRRLKDPTTVPLAPVADAGAEQWQWYGQHVMPREALARLADSRCEVQAFLRFSRAPWGLWSAKGVILGDMRYDREPELGFSEIALAPTARCPTHVPPWITPVSRALAIF